VLHSRPDHVLIEHHPGIIGWDMLAEVVRRLHGKTKITVELHSCAGDSSLVAAVPSLQFANRVITHNGRDYMRAARLLGTDKASLIPHGVGAPLPTLQRPRNSTGGDGAKLVSFGMAGPHKGFHKVIEAMALLREAGLDIEYRLFTSLPSKDRSSRQYLSYCIERAHQLGLQDRLGLDLHFQPIDDLLIKLNECDIGVLAYDEDVMEGASGAARVMLRANLPLVLTDGPIFEEFQGIGVTVNGTGFALAQALYELVRSPDARSEVLERQAAFTLLVRRSHSHVHPARLGSCRVR
jgi:glycosyltransferase involved in cell wall biosynthesis